MKERVAEYKPVYISGGSVVNSPPAMQETWVRSLSQEDPLEKEMAIQDSYLRNPMDRGDWQA